MLIPGQRVHIIGVGGFGMSAIARVLLGQGYAVSGSDLRANALTRELAAAGARIFQGHAADHIAGAEAVIRSSAVPDDNPEVVAARAAGIPVLWRRDALKSLLHGQLALAVAGTHGKTTTSALLAHTLIEAGRDPSYIVGGVLANTGTNAGVGAGGLFVIEADEYDRMFLGLNPQFAIITNIEHDHPDCFPTEADVLAAFATFAGLVPQGGVLIVCADDPHARALGQQRIAAGARVLWYAVEGEAPPGPVGAGWWARDLEPDAAGGMTFTACRGETVVGRARLNLPGRHNVQNALAVLALVDLLGVPFERVAAAFDSFLGTGRRGEVMGQAGGVTVVNDYAHHPTAIRATLAAWRARPGLRELWAVWQPHTYTRLRALAGEFSEAFAAADHALVTDVYSVRETVTPGLDAAGAARLIAATGHPHAEYTGDLERTARVLAMHVQPGDLVLLLSAGDAPTIGRRLLALLDERAHED